MIKVTIELISGITGQTTHLGTGYICNDMTGSKSVGNYYADFHLKQERQKSWRTATITGFPRLRLYAWDLLYRALKDAVGERNK